jgi:hypothetical protein
VPAEGNGARASIFERLRHALRGVDHAEAAALPVGEALHPVALAAVALLAVNDWLLKPRLGAAAGPLTGKLSDIAGLAFAPVVLSAAIGLVLHAAARLGARVDPSLSRRRLIACTVATGAGFAAVKLVPAAAAALAAAISLVRPARFVLDRSDLWCLPAVAIAWWIGRDELRRVPLGRPAAVHRLGRPAAAALADVRWAGAPADRVAELARAIDAWDPAAIDGWLTSAGAHHDANR